MEAIPPITPWPRGKEVNQHMYMDSNKAGSK